MAREFGLTQLRSFVVRHLWLLVALPVVAAAATVFVLRLMPQRYEASVTLLVSQLDIELAIEGQPLPLHGVRWILESPPVLRAAEELIAQQSEGREIELILGGNAETEMLLRRREESALAPMIELTTRAESAELAILMADAWSEAFVEHLSGLRETELASALDTMGQALGDAETSLREVEKSRSEHRAEYEKETGRLASQWRAQSAKVLARHDQRLADLRAETRTRLSEVLESFRGYREEMSPSARAALEQVLSMRLSLAGVPERLVLISSLVPDSVVVTDQELGPGELDPSAVSFAEQVNPNYLELSAEVLEAEKELFRLTEEDSTLRRLLAEVAEVQVRGGVTRQSHEFARFGDLRLEEQRRRISEESLRREFEVIDDQLGRQLDESLQYRALVEKRHRDALLSVRAQGGVVPIRTAAEAVVPRTPIGRDLLRRTAVAGVLGLLLALGLGVVRDLS